MTSYVPAGSEFDVNSTFTRSQAQSDGAQLADGGFIITWVDADFNTTALHFIKAQLYQSDGTPVDTELKLVSEPGLINPAVTGLAGGGFVVSWEGISTIRAQVFDQHGVAVGPAFDVSPTGASSTDRPDVAALDTGGFAIVWHDTRSSGGDVSGSAVHFRTFDGAGAPVSSDTLVNSATAGNQADASITALSDGHYVVTWTDRGAPGSGASWLIKGRIVDKIGTSLGSEFVVNAATSKVTSVESSVTTLANGNFAVAWEESDLTGSAHRIRVFDPSGAAVGSQITVPQSLSGTQAGPKLIGLADGGFAIAWTANASPQSDGSGKAVFVQIFDAASLPAGDPMLVNTQQNGDQFDPALTAIASGGFVVSWTDLNGAGADDDQVKAQLFLPTRPIAITSDGGGENAAIAVNENQALVTHVVATGGPSLTYAIDGGDDAVLFTIDPVTGVLRFANAPDFETPGGDGDNVYLVRVRASDASFSDTQTLAVTVGNVNEAPVITSNGGGDTAALTVMENTVFVGTVVASDPEGATTYSIAGGADAARFTIDAATGALTFVAAPDYEAPADANGDNRYEVVVTASDGALQDTQTLAVTVGNVNEAPVITSNGGGDTAALTVMENTVFVGTVVASDPEGATTYSIAGGADAARFTIDAATGALTFVAAPDYEAPADANGDNRYEVVVTASDGALQDTQTLAVTVGNVNEAPVITSNGGGDTAALTVMENTVFVGAVVASDPEGATTYSIAGGADAARFTIDAATGALTFVAAPDYEAPADANGDNRYEVVVAASDGALQDTQTLAVTVGNVNEAPVITSNGGGDTAALTVMENTVFVGAVVASDPEGATTYSIAGGADAARFTIDAATGALTFVAAPDYEAPADANGDNRYEVVVAASDGALQDTQTLAVTVGNVNEAPVITSHGGGDTATLTVMENTVLVGAVVASDPEGATTYSIAGGADAARFTIDAATGALTFVAAPDYEAPADANGDNRYEVVVAASDGALQDTQTLAVTVGNVNEAPVITSHGGGDTATLTVMENTVLVGAVVASDPEGATTYSIAGGADAARFTIDAATGALTFVAAPDYEAPADANGDNRYGVVVTASDGALQDTQTLSVAIGNSADGGTINGTNAADALTGGAAEDVINGLGGNDVLSGLGGADTITGGGGNDSLSGGDGDDVFQVGAGAGVDSVNGGAGSDKIVALANGVTIGLSALSGIEAINANGYSAVNIAGSTASDTLDFSGVTLSGIASIDGGSGNDIIAGSTGDDVILGAAGDDSLSGGGGNDTLTGGAGSDQLSGGAGSDLFAYSAPGESKGANIDTIVDFQSLQGDRIDLSAIDASSKVAGDQAFAWIGDSGFHKIAGELREAIGADGNVHVYADTSGGGKVDFELILLGTPQLVGSDFIL